MSRTRKYDHKQIIRLAKAGWSDGLIAQHIGCSRDRVIQIRRAAKIFHSTGSHKPKRKAQEVYGLRQKVRELKQQGNTYEEIGNALGIARQRAQQLLAPTSSELAALLERAKYSCENCGATNVKLHAHHSTYDGAPDKILCVSCHRSAHSQPCTPVTVLLKTSDISYLENIQKEFGWKDMQDTFTNLLDGLKFGAGWRPTIDKRLG